MPSLSVGVLPAPHADASVGHGTKLGITYTLTAGDLPMFRRLPLLLGLFLPSLVVPAASAAEPLQPAIEWVAPDAVAVLEVANPKPLLDLALNPKLAEMVKGLPPYKEAVAQPQFQQFLMLVKYLETKLGGDWQSSLRKLLDGGVTIAAYPNGDAVTIIDAADAKILEQLHEVVLTIAKGEAAKKGQAEGIKSQEYQGVTGWTFGPGEAHAIIGKRLLLTNRPARLKSTVDLRGKPAESIAKLPAYRDATKAAGNAAVRTFVNVAMVKKNPGVEKALTENADPMAALLFAGVADALRGANWASAALQVDSGTLALKLTMDGQPADPKSPTAFTWPAGSDGALPNLDVPRRLAAMSLYRDLHAFYAAKDKLFPERTSGLIFFENMMGIFFTGRDLTEEIFAETKPDVRVIVASQAYDPAVGTPQIQLPAFAIVVRAKNPKQFGEVMEEAWQKAFGLINVTRGQKAEPGLILDKGQHADVRYTLSYFSSAGQKSKTGIDVRYNFRPTLARAGDCVVLSSTDGLANDIIDALKKEAAAQPKPAAQTHSVLQIDGAAVANILAANRAGMVQQNMVEKGHTQAQAETEIDVLVAVVRTLGQAEVTLGRDGGQPNATLKIKLNLP
jgi:hypothetical protein